ncbi:MAG: PKD domain-containing protein [Gemmataceae bacterium]|nr:PKD domain-containing protein [Gemmataceae bacterium]
MKLRLQNASAVLRALLVAACLLHTIPVQADVTLPKVFSAHAVLQRDLRLPIWGTAEPGEKVTVKLGDAQATATADAMGKWSLKLPAMKINALGQDMIVTGKNTVTVKDVLIGDVWLCGGQSNMELPLKDCDAKDDIATADFPMIRCLMTTNVPTLKKLPNDVIGEWKVCTPDNAPRFTGAGFYFARRVYKETGVPIGLIWAGFGGTVIDVAIGPEGLALEPTLAASYLEITKWPDHIAAGSVYASKIKFIAPYAIKGSLWYQGEWNGGDTTYYRRMRALIGGWRELWRQGDFPFYFVQLPDGHWFDPYARPEPAPGEPPTRDMVGGGIGITRWMQFQSLQIPNTGMAITIDIGGGLHPTNKFDCGERLARLALHDQYGKKDLVPSGPLYRDMKIEGNKIRISFDHVGSGLMMGKKKGRMPTEEEPGAKLRTFAVAGDDFRWVWADAVIDGASVVVSSPAVTNPVAARYAFSSNPKGANLYNREGLPASPFRTDELTLLRPKGRKLILCEGWTPGWDTDFRLRAPFDTTVEGSIRDNRIERLVVTPPGRRLDVVIAPPFLDMLAFMSDPPTGEAPLTVRFDAGSVIVPDGPRTSYNWDFGDGTKAEGAEVSHTHTFTKPGTYKVWLRLKDAKGWTAEVPRIITVTPLDTTPPAIEAISIPRQANRVVVIFTEPVLQADAEIAANYTLEPQSQVIAATMGEDGKTVTLKTGPLKRGDCRLIVRNIRDRARKPNVLTEARKEFHNDALYAWWKLDEAKGDEIRNATGSSPDGFSYKSTWSNVGGRTALSFNGQWATVETGTNLEDLTVPFTIAFWVNPASKQRVCANIFGNRGFQGNTGGFHMEQDQLEMNSYAFSYVNGQNVSATAPVQLAADEWQHVAVTCDGSSIIFYVNGVEKTRAAATAAFVPNRNMPLLLGAWTQNRYFAGHLSDFRIYRAALTAAEVQAVLKEIAVKQ